MFMRFLSCLLLLGISMSSSIASNHKVETATFAGGCFWCMEKPFEMQHGVWRVVSGYAGGSQPKPTYELVSSGQTGYVEAVQVQYDPQVISYQKLLNIYWQQIDPTDMGGQFSDRGKQYKAIIFYHDEEQKTLANKSKLRLEQLQIFNKLIVIEIKPFTTFYPAEEYHQDYYKKHPVKYNLFRYMSGRNSFLKKVWTQYNIKKLNVGDRVEKPGMDELRKKLTPMQFHITQENGTERPFNNAYWDNKQVGIYVDIVSGEPLFSSKDKFASGTGWPSFTKPLEPDNMIEKLDRSLFSKRIEVRSKQADSHLGHVFKDGPAPTHLRYCVNSAALRFIPKTDLEKEGYNRYLKQFNDQLTNTSQKVKKSKEGQKMPFTLSPLLYSMDALVPYISQETLEYHYGKHHQGYVNKLNALTENSELAKKSLEELIKHEKGAVFNNAAQIWNHTFYWQCLTPNGGGKPSGKLGEAIEKTFGSFEAFQNQFKEKALGNFGSGWTWLVKNADGSIEIMNTSNAGNPMTADKKPLLTCDVWEHAYYIDYRNGRANYLDNFWKIVNWKFVESNF